LKQGLGLHIVYIHSDDVYLVKDVADIGGRGSGFVYRAGATVLDDRTSGSNVRKCVERILHTKNVKQI
jgi:hypothetical protein